MRFVNAFSLVAEKSRNGAGEISARVKREVEKKGESKGKKGVATREKGGKNRLSCSCSATSKPVGALQS